MGPCYKVGGDSEHACGKQLLVGIMKKKDHDEGWRPFSKNDDQSGKLRGGERLREITRSELVVHEIFQSCSYRRCI